MNYKNGKIYKVQFDDGHFYYGSSAGELRARLHKHRKGSGRTTACSRYMKIVGKDACRIVLVEDYPCENRDQLRRKEDEYIQLHRENPLCLNINRAFTTPEEKKAYYTAWREEHREELIIAKREYYEAHREETIVAKREYNKAHKEERDTKQKAYYETHKEERRAYNRAYRERIKAQKNNVE